MIIDFGISTVGKSHIKNGTCCQDSHCIKKMQNGWIIAAVADGVGSAKNSSIGSEIAAKTVVKLCEECMPWDYNVISIKSMIRTAYNYAFKQILRESEQSGEPIESYDTTLSMVIYDGKRIIYGHSGDGAIIGLTTFGDYVEITRPQKSDDGVSVIPLRGGYTQWVIDSYEEDLVAVLLMTDGMLETLCHYLLRDYEKKTKNVYVPLASYFADPYGFEEKHIEEIREDIFDFVVADEEYNSTNFYNRLLRIYEKHLPEKAKDVVDTFKKLNYPVGLMQMEQDDKTIVGLVNTELPFDDKDESFYSEPDWTELQEAWNRKAYPHLYANSNTENELNTDVSSINDGDVAFSENTASDMIIEIKDNKEETEADGLIDSTVDKKELDTSTSLKKESKTEATSNKLNSTEIPLHAYTRHEESKKKGFFKKMKDLLD